ncbi:MAG: hypothetical protein O2887_14550 [Bacteroidetes bacterium]|nr:hypothetical protein [Bacteroidota bacterium]MDA1121689.1 hypothetical protein [Bacteroidota bacterium]
MQKNQLNTELQSLERRLILLITEHKNLKGETEILKAQNQELKQLLKSKEDQIENFNNKDKISKFVDSMVASENNTTELKQVINEYIKEIDKCIVHLSE